MKTFVAIAPLLARRPPTWGCASLRRVARLREATNKDGAAPLLSLTSAGAIRDRDPQKQPPSDDYLLRYGMVEAGDLVVNPMWLAGGGIGVSSTRGAVSPEYRIYELSQSLMPRFVHHLVRSEPYLRQYGLLVRAETTFDRRVTKEDFRELPILIPPMEEQRAIAHYLDAETARIDALIDKKRRMMVLLDESRRSIAARAVTVGLEDAPRTHETKNPFAPTLPEAWELRRLKTVVTNIVDTPHATAPGHDDGKFLVVRTANVKAGRLVLDDAVWTDEETWRQWNRRAAPSPGDVMFTREAPAGEACAVPSDPPLCIGQRMVLLVVDRNKTCADWLVHSVYSGPAQGFIALLSRSTTVAHLNMGEIGNIPIVVPALEVQIRTLRLLRERLAPIEGAMSALDTQLALLSEHRQVLITAAVTGELDIPGVAA